MLANVTLMLLQAAAPVERGEGIQWVLLLDQSRSVQHACSAYVTGARSVAEGLLRDAPGDRPVRISVFAITASSFEVEPLIDMRLPKDGGRYRAIRSGGTANVLQVLGMLRPESAPCSAAHTDILGAIERASLQFESRFVDRQLIILGDSREDGSILNLEGPAVFDAAVALRRVREAGRIPDLTGVKVCILGVHTRGITPAFWSRLRAFWIEYFRAAGAVLSVHDFTPSFSCSLANILE